MKTRLEIGLKTCTVLLLTIVSTAVTAYIILHKPHTLLDLKPAVGFIIGLGAFLATYATFKFWNLAGEDRFAISILFTRDRDAQRTPLFTSDFISLSLVASGGASRNIPGLLIKGFYALSFVCLGFMAFDNQGFLIGKQAPKTLFTAKNDFCPDEDLEPEKVVKLGCELVIKAYELGYRKSLGDCDPFLEAGQSELPPICEKRRTDEPYFHYAYRLLAGFWQEHLPHNIEQSWQAELDLLKRQLKNVYGHLFKQTKSLLEVPRASHHIFTNLPHPEGWLGEVKSFSIGDDYCETAPESTAGSASLSDSHDFEAGIVALMFDQRHAPGVGYCPEYSIHWGAKSSVCSDLAKDPEVFFNDAGINAQISGVVARIRSRDTGNDAGAGDDQKDWNRYLSFQCLLVGVEGRIGYKQYQFTFLGKEFQAAEKVIPAVAKSGNKVASTDYFHHVGQMMAPGFSSVAFEGQGAVFDEDLPGVGEDIYQSDDQFLTKLELLKAVDIYQGQDWILEKSSLLDVYPWHRHQKAFIERFRKTYQQKRGRL